MTNQDILPSNWYHYQLDHFLLIYHACRMIPGAVDGLNGKQTNTLIYQVARRKVPWMDDDLVLAATTTGDPNGL